MPLLSSKKPIRTFSTTPANSVSGSENGIPGAVSIDCPLCGSSMTGKCWHTEYADFVRCDGCGLWRQNPQPPSIDVLARYDDAYLAYETSRHMEYRSIALMSLAEAGLHPDRKIGDARMLEIGCATGALLSVFAEAGWNTTGVEVGSSLAAYARTHFGLDVRTGTLDQASLRYGSFDVIMALHLVEHLNEPVAFLAQLRKLVSASGAVYLVTPNADSFQSRLTGARWRSAIRDHLFLFSVVTLRNMARKAGFRTEYIGTWGGWPAGMKPAILKKPIDALVKILGWGDVMIMRLCPVSDERNPVDAR